MYTRCINLLLGICYFDTFIIFGSNFFRTGNSFFEFRRKDLCDRCGCWSRIEAIDLFRRFPRTNIEEIEEWKGKSVALSRCSVLLHGALGEGSSFSLTEFMQFKVLKWKNLVEENFRLSYEFSKGRV